MNFNGSTMNHSNLFHRPIFVFLLLFVALNLCAQSNEVNDVFVPEVGQEGKDVVWVPTSYELVNKMLEDLVKACSPKQMIVEGEFNLRGGIKTTVSAEYRKNKK